jgi:hypothetical protein
MPTNPRSPNALIAAMILCAGAAVGCDRSKSPAVATVAPSDGAPLVQPASPATAPATQPATQPAASSLLINGVFKQFPPARLRLIVEGDHVTAVLYSADPATAINDDYAGNSFYLSMPLTDVKDLASMDGAEWRFKSINSERADTTDGIFLEGLKHQLQPMDVIVRFEGTGSSMRVRLAGEFLDFQNATPLMPGVLTPVAGDLTADVDHDAGH